MLRELLGRNIDGGAGGGSNGRGGAVVGQGNAEMEAAGVRLALEKIAVQLGGSWNSGAAGYHGNHGNNHQSPYMEVTRASFQCLVIQKAKAKGWITNGEAPVAAAPASPPRAERAVGAGRLGGGNMAGNFPGRGGPGVPAAAAAKEALLAGRYEARFRRVHIWTYNPRFYSRCRRGSAGRRAGHRGGWS